MTRSRILPMIATLTSLVLAAPVFAEGPNVGCYMRDYTAAHLAKYPTQVVDRIALRVFHDDNSNTLAHMWVDFADQGHVRGTGFAGQRADQFLLCFDDQGRSGCAVECDGGNFYVTKQPAKGLTFKTNYLMVGDTDMCGGAVDLAEVQGQAVSYRLDRVAASVCAAE